MNIPFRKVAVLGAALALVGAGLMASSSGSGSSTGDKSLEIAYWNYGPAAQAQNKGSADAVIAHSPGVKIALTPVAGENWGHYYANIATLIAAGKRPDLMTISGEGAQFVHANKLVLPINSYLASDPEAKALVDDIAPGLIKGFTVGGDVVTLTYGWKDMVVYYNTDLFKAA